MKFKDFLTTDEENETISTNPKPISTIQVIKIKHYPEDVVRTTDLLKSGDAVIADCTSLKADTKDHANDFLAGACAMGNDQMLTIAPQIYLLTPKSVLVKTDQDREDITPETLDETSSLTSSEQEPDGL